MLFDSITFCIFFVVLFCLYWQVTHRNQNKLLLLASYFFYGCWDWRFLSLILISTLVDYFCGQCIHNSKSQLWRKRYLALSLVSNLGILGFFKYFDFFADSLALLTTNFGLTLDRITLDIILPVGISFYTFQSLSYTIDIYRRDLKPCNNPLDFFLYVSFFPQLVAGPIERAGRLLPQIQCERSLSWVDLRLGIAFFSWGLFQKVYVADNLAPIVDTLFSSPGPYVGSEVLVGIYAFSFQLLCDFAGYSLMAKGLARILGFELTTNFRQPYFSSNIREFWSRWHVTLSNWFRDYFFRTIRKRLNRKGNWQIWFNFFITFSLIGLWHGASWNFVLWGALTGIQVVVYLALQPQLKKLNFRENSFQEKTMKIASMILVYHCFCFGGALFRGESFEQSIAMYYALFSNFMITENTLYIIQRIIFYAGVFMFIEWLQYRFKKEDDLVFLQFPIILRSFFYVIIFYSLTWFGKLDGEQYIYFQF